MLTPNAEQVKTAVLYLLAASGPLYQLLIEKGLTPDQIGSIQNLAITFGPMLVASGIAIARRTRDAIVAAAARQIADKGKITLLPGSGIATELARNPAVPNVVNGSVKSHWAIGWLAIAVAASLALGGCATGSGGAGDGVGGQVKTQLSTSQGQANALGTAYALAKAGFAIYASTTAADPAIVAQVTKAIAVADVAIPKAQAAILAAPNQDAQTVAVQAGYAALDVFNQALATYGLKKTE